MNAYIVLQSIKGNMVEKVFIGASIADVEKSFNVKVIGLIASANKIVMA
jgi:hypothetical protein